MKKSDLKRILKPIVKECINETLIEQGLLSNIISEVVQGLQPFHTQPTISAAPSHEVLFQKEELQEERTRFEEERRHQLKEQKRKLLDAAGFKTDVFADTEPIQGGITTEGKETHPTSAALSGIDPNDSGVDISGIMNLSGKNWGKLI